MRWVDCWVRLNRGGTEWKLSLCLHVHDALLLPELYKDLVRMGSCFPEVHRRENVGNKSKEEEGSRL